MKCPEFIPDDIAKKAIIFDYEIAWRRKELLELLPYLEKIKKGILGGIVYTYKDNQVDTRGAGGANWYTELKKDDTEDSHALRSINETYEYLKKLPENDNYIFSITFLDNLTFEEMWKLKFSKDS